jgi:hypothetical protein
LGFIFTHPTRVCRPKSIDRLKKVALDINEQCFLMISGQKILF